MKIIGVSNFNEEGINDIIVAENVTKIFIDSIVSFLNNEFSGNTKIYYFKKVEDDYNLYTYDPNK